jgi:hypothetical protein
MNKVFSSCELSSTLKGFCAIAEEIVPGIGLTYVPTEGTGSVSAGAEGTGSSPGAGWLALCRVEQVTEQL